MRSKQIPQSGWDKLFVTSIPVDSPKATSKTMKAHVRNGTCKWADPIYETTGLLQDIKTKQFDAKLYKLVVAMGSSRSSVLGEAMINLVDYADALKPSAVSLPLQGCDFGTTLHVSIQLLSSKTGFREFQQHRELREKGLITNQNCRDESSSGKLSSSEDTPDHHTDKVNNKDPDLAVRIGDSSITLQSACIETHDRSKEHENGSLETANGDLVVAHEENNRLRACLEAAESMIVELKMEINLLQNHADEIRFELQKLAEQLVADVTSGMELAQEISVLKSESSKLKDELGQRKVPKLCSEFDILSEFERSKSEKESLLERMNQMECYYESLVHELEENQNLMLEELQNLRNEHSTCEFTLMSTKAEMEAINHSLKTQIATLNEDKEYLNSINKELERRAITAESVLKSGRLSYSIAVDRMQKDLELLSSQIMYMSETNKKLIRLALADFSQLSYEGHLDVAESKEFDSGALEHIHFQNQLSKIQNCHLDHDILLEDMKRSLYMQEEIYRKVEGEVCELHFANVYLDVFSKALQGTLLEAKGNMTLVNGKVRELVHQVEFSTESRVLLTQKLDIAMNDIRSLDEGKANYIAKCNDLALENQNLKDSIRNAASERKLLLMKIDEWESQLVQYQVYQSKYENCTEEKTKLTYLLELKTSENHNLKDESSTLRKQLENMKAELGNQNFMKENLQSSVNFLRNGLQNLLESYGESIERWTVSGESGCQDMDLAAVLKHLEELQHNACEKIFQLTEEKKGMVLERDIAQASTAAAESEISLLKQTFQDEMHNMVNRLNMSNALVEKLRLRMESLATGLQVSSNIEERFAVQQSKLLSYLNHFEVELQELISESRSLAFGIKESESIVHELEMSKMTVEEFIKENRVQMALLQEKTEESSRLISELKSTKDSLQLLQDENQILIASSGDKSQEHAQLVAELSILKESFSSLQSENRAVVASSQAKGEEFLKLNLELKSLKESYESLSNEKEALVAYSREKNEEVAQLSLEINSSRMHLQSLHDENQHLSACSRDRAKKSMQLASEVNSLKEKMWCLSDELQGERSLKERLENTLESLSCKLSKEASLVSCLEMQLHELQELLIDADVRFIFIKTQYEQSVDKLVQNCPSDQYLGELHEHTDLGPPASHRCSIDSQCTAGTKGEVVVENRTLNMEHDCLKSRDQHRVVFERLKNLSLSSEEEIESLMLFKEDMEVQLVVLRARLLEQRAQVILLKNHQVEVTTLQEQCSELSRRLSEQILKTEEFKNLSIHFRELKEKAEAYNARARDKREHERRPAAMQESLRIALVKEQYETKLQELKHQLAISKKHGEEILWKLQDAIDEIENRKKSETSCMKKNEELMMKILELDAELQSLLSEKREKINAYDSMKAEKECLSISLECCKEEKQKLEASLQELNKENLKLGVELAKLKELLENSRSIGEVQAEGNDGSHKLISVNAHQENLIVTMDQSPSCLENYDLKDYVAKSICPVPAGELDKTSPSNDGQPEKLENSVTGDENAVYGSPFISQGKLIRSDLKHFISDHHKAESFKSSLDHLSNELERMKNDNLLLQDNNNFREKFPGLQKELIQLQKANEELANRFPLFKELSRSGNALERVLALELELAEALQAKKRSSIHFQSSFLKQHNDEEAVFESFRDINELIKDMLELKGRYATVENELKEMHECYSELSLQFAEVEGERQKLMMTLKNTRTSKKALQLNRS